MTTIDLSTTGFLSNRLESLVSPVPILLAVIVLLLGLAFAACGAEACVWLSHWGKPRGTLSGRGYIPGGIGGVFFGAVVSAAFYILVTLLIVAKQAAPTLGGWGVFAILLTTSLPGAFLGSRFRFVARAFVGLLGAISLTLLFTATFKLATLLPRLVILAISIPVFLLLSLLPQTRHRSLSLFSALAGALLLTLGLDLLLKAGFVDLLGLLASTNGASANGLATAVVVNWSSSAGKGLIAAWWISAVAGGGWQWWYSGSGSGDVDESWNTYMSNFTSTHSSSLGSFTPHQSFLSRLFSRQTSSSPAPLTALPRRRHSPWDESDDFGDDPEKGGVSDAWDPDADTLASRSAHHHGRMTKGAWGKASSQPAKYGEYHRDDDDDPEEDEEKPAAVAFLEYHEGKARQRDTDGESRMSGSTFVGGVAAWGREKLVLQQEEEEEDERDDVPDLYSIPYAAPTLTPDDDEDATLRPRKAKKLAGSLKGFFGRSPAPPVSYPGPKTRSLSPLPLSPTNNDVAPRIRAPAPKPAIPFPVTTTSAPAPAPPKGAVKATPSLIFALERVNAAQKQARGEVVPWPLAVSPAAPRVSNDEAEGRGDAGRPVRKRTPSWDDWWKDVVVKAETK